jgi:hypothetical protein
VSERVRLVGDDPSGLAEMLAAVLSDNLRADPVRVATLRPSVVVVAVPDAGVAVTVRIGPGSIAVADGEAAAPDLRIAADAGTVLCLPAAPLRWGLPDPLRRDGRLVLGHLARGRLRVEGMLRHPRHLASFTSLLSVRRPAGTGTRP